MMSAGLLGGPGLGYAKDRFAGESLREANSALYETHKAAAPSKFLFFGEAYGLDGKKLGDVGAKLEEFRKQTPNDPKAAYQKLSADERTVHESSIRGDRRTLVADSVIPATMAVIYLVLLVYFKTIGGYKIIHIEAEKLTGGVEAPVR
jgi:hypothetical protein